MHCRHPFECVYWGCIDPTNYDEYADVDDGSIPFIEGV